MSVSFAASNTISSVVAKLEWQHLYGDGDTESVSATLPAF